MKKVLLVTLWGNTNLGNKLQNYALQRLLEKEGCEVYTAICYEKMPKDIAFKHSIKKILARIGIKKYNGIRLAVIRERVLQDFSEKYVKNPIYIKCFSDAFKIDEREYDYGVTGSDQVWHNWFNARQELDYYYLTFLPQNKRIAFAGSFGFDYFPDKDINMHVRGLNGLKYISCREQRGVELIHQLVNREAVLMPDPTLCLSRKEWDELAKEPNYDTSKPYMLLYFLGNISKEYQEVINKIVEEKNLVIINILDATNLDKYLTSPEEFVWIIAHADYVCTDSFHATAFSIIYERQFLVFQRIGSSTNNMFSRIRTLLDTNGLQECEYKEKNAISKNISFATASKVISHNNEIARNYIKQAIE